MLNRLPHNTKRIILLIFIIIASLWVGRDFIMKFLPKDTSNSIQNNIIDPVLSITTNCSLLEDEIKKDEDCRWSLNCRLSRNEQVAYEKRKINFEKFCELTGAEKMLGRFMPGTLTNPSLSYFSEPHLIVISDPQVDAQAINEATNAGIPVIGIANTDNVTSELDLVIPANNRGRKSLATVYWLLANEILQDSKAMKYEIDDFETKTSEVEEEL